jgi:hypothetical protein
MHHPKDTASGLIGLIVWLIRYNSANSVLGIAGMHRRRQID